MVQVGSVKEGSTQTQMVVEPEDCAAVGTAAVAEVGED